MNTSIHLKRVHVWVCFVTCHCILFPRLQLKEDLASFRAEVSVSMFFCVVYIRVCVCVCVCVNQSCGVNITCKWVLSL